MELGGGVTLRQIVGEINSTVLRVELEKDKTSKRISFIPGSLIERFSEYRKDIYEMIEQGQVESIRGYFLSCGMAEEEVKKIFGGDYPGMIYRVKSTEEPEDWVYIVTSDEWV